jgi:DNA-binding NarL/FixJ family response regulator
MEDLRNSAITITGPRVRLKTFIVEDNATIRENLIDTLEELTCVQAVGTAETELEGRQWLTQNTNLWNLAIVDLFLQQGTGLGVLEACQGRHANQKVIVLSNYATADIRLRCAQLGVDAVFDKSNEIDALVTYCLEQCQHSKN